MIFDTYGVWVRVFNLPLNWIDESYGRMIGNKLGKAISMDVGEEGIGGLGHIEKDCEQRLLKKFRETRKNEEMKVVEMGRVDRSGLGMGRVGVRNSRDNVVGLGESGTSVFPKNDEALAGMEVHDEGSDFDRELELG
ncbi:hypothetical protein ACH5RR_015176 [Cinchona calisaya]|uniref:DUF4283 domain-containing protein n=1 Tax=Cinchona calisaya TaxID=153742 RepID=A0ABD2ZSD5_9GENT